MLDKSFGLHFYLKKPKDYVKGIIPKRSCEPNRWNAAAERALGTKEDARALNAYLDTLQAKAYEAKRRLIESNQMITAAALKDQLLCTNQRNKSLIKIFENYNDHVKKLIGIDYSVAT